MKKVMAITAVVAIFLLSCSHHNVSLDETTAKGEVPQLGNLVFHFSRAVVPDSMVNQWDSTEYISFKPAIPGRFRWEGPEELVFSPSRPLLPATTYHITVRDEVVGHSRFEKVENTDDLSFHTAPLQLAASQVSWILADEASRTIVPQLQLQFNYPVKPEDLQDHLQLRLAEQDVTYNLQQVSGGNKILLRLQDIKPADKARELSLVIEKGLVPLQGNDKTSEPISEKISLPSPSELQITSVETEHDGTEGRVRIYTNQQLNQQDLAALIHFRPAVKFAAAYDAFGVVLRSADFQADAAYSYTISKTVRGVAGGSMPEEYAGTVAFGELEAGIQFLNSKAMYLSKLGAGNLEVRITNIPKVKVVISRIYENNLLTAQRNGYYPQEPGGSYASYDEEEGYEGGSMEEVGVSAGDVIYSKEVDTRSLPKSAGGRLLNLRQFEDRLPDSKGIYHVSIRSVKEYWQQDSRFISFSDLGLIARQGTDEVLVFVNSLKTAASQDGVTVQVYGSNNQLLGGGSTAADGVATIRIPKKNFPGFRPAMIIAKTADDFNFLPFSNTQVNTSRFEVGGRRSNSSGLDAYIYAPRDIYRPGETLQYSVLLRDKSWKSPGELPVKIRFLLPNGKEWKLFRKGLNEQGATEGTVPIPDAALTGSYQMEVYSANDVMLASRDFRIEEFVPDRIRVRSDLSREWVAPSDELELKINAQNFFGPPAAGRNYETEIQVRQKTFTAAAFPDYNFSLTNQQSFFDKDVREGITDGEGNAAIRYAVPSFYKNNGLLQARFYTTVFDETGRPVSKHVAADIFTQDVFFGIRDDGSYYYSLNQPVQLQLAAVDRKGNGISAKASVKVIKHEYRTVLTRSGSYFRYESQKELKVIESNFASFSGKGSYTFVPRTPGDYEIRVADPASHTYVSKYFYSYGSWGADNSSFEVNTDGAIDMSADKEEYQTGETAKILFKTPFSGRMLVTLEKDGVLSHQYLDVARRTASLDVKLSAAHVPNVYITATLFKPHEASGIPLTVAHGFKSIAVQEKKRIIPVQITAQKSVRSRTHQQVRVKGIAGSYVTLAAVDNGVLQVSGFETPDPYQYFYQKQALGVAAYDLYPLLFPEIAARFSSTGGDANIEMEKRVNPMQARRVRIMSYWSGMKKTGADGTAVFDFEIPQFSGELRLMAVAFKDEKMGAAAATMTVADPIILSSGLPRFFSPGDTALVPVTISNTTAKPAQAKAMIFLSGPVQLAGANTQLVSIPPHAEATAQFEVVASPSIGIGNIKIDVTALGEKFTDETEISIRPAVPLQKRTGGGYVAGGKTQAITLPVNDFLPGTVQYNLVVSTHPLAELAGQLQYLITYPFGCTEQVVSSAFPQLYAGDFAEKAGLGKTGQNAAGNVLEAIRKIKLRQLYNGALTLWDGEDKEDWWTTVYAAHFLIEAKKAGYEVDPSLLETVLGYIASRLQSRHTIQYFYNRDQQKKIAPKEVPYSLFVLALANRAQVSSMNYYKANDELLALDGRYLLSAAYALSGDKRSAAAFLPKTFSGEYSVQQSGGSYYSALRDEGVALNALLEMDPSNAQIPVMAQHLRDQLKNNQYLNTQERSFAFLALGKMARLAGGNNVTAEIRSGGKKVADIRGNWKGSRSQLPHPSLELVAKGNGRLYYSWMAEGISGKGLYREEDNFIKVRRAFYDRNGNQLSGSRFQQNDLVIVGITIEKAFSTDIENIVITDLLPAGFEIENPRTKELPGMDWIRNASNPVSLDVRDDRIHLFVDLFYPRQTYYYAVRAVSPGIFRQGPVSADAMYRPEYHSYHGAGWITVVGRKE